MPTDPDFESVSAGANVSHPDVPKDFKTHVITGSRSKVGKEKLKT
jgi:hypothetical protein